ncbi:serine hydrolase [candidate division KSB1 bacterium]|nr:serine hydrolase [candidate division KSB1 bacterium]
MQTMKLVALSLAAVIMLMPLPCNCQRLKQAKPENVNMSSEHLDKLRTVILSAIENKDFPGAVLTVGRQGKIVFNEAFGECQWVPSNRKMHVDMIFDLASITKPVATASSVMILIQNGALRLFDRADNFIPEFTPFQNENGKPGEPVRIYHLLTHTSGLPPYTSAKEVTEKYGKPCPDSLIGHIARIKKLAPPGEKFRYSCLGFILLAEIVKRVSRNPVNEFAAEHIFKPLGMNSTTFNPSPDLIDRCVPTEAIDGIPLIGTVHDPLAQLMGGVSGNAGLFSTAGDLAIFAQMLLQQGEYDGKRILSPLAVKRMTTIYERTAFSGRALGWDVSSDYSTNGGDLFSPESYGHTGYTGTSIWIDPTTRTFVIFLTNRVHPDDSGKVIATRSFIANIVASSIMKP